MQSNLSCYQLKIACQKYKMFRVSLIVTTKQKPMLDTQKIKSKELKHTTRENNLITGKGSKRGRKNKRIYKTTTK